MIYFYCVSPTTQDDIIQSLVGQLAWSSDGTSIEPSVQSLYNHAKSPNGTRPLQEDWLRVLVGLCRRINRIIIVIDALDECVDFSNLLTNLKELQRDLGNRVKFVFSSRMNVVVDQEFPDSPLIELSPKKTSTDMLKYIECEVRFRENLFDCNDETSKRLLSDRIVSVLTQLAGGM
jgi:hypothetical protein